MRKIKRSSLKTWLRFVIAILDTLRMCDAKAEESEGAPWLGPYFFRSLANTLAFSRSTSSGWPLLASRNCPRQSKLETTL